MIAAAAYKDANSGQDKTGTGNHPAVQKRHPQCSVLFPLRNEREMRMKQQNDPIWRNGQIPSSGQQSGSENSAERQAQQQNQKSEQHKRSH